MNWWADDSEEPKDLEAILKSGAIIVLLEGNVLVAQTLEEWAHIYVRSTENLNLWIKHSVEYPKVIEDPVAAVLNARTSVWELHDEGNLPEGAWGEMIAYDITIPYDVDVDRIDRLVSKWGELQINSCGCGEADTLAFAAIYAVNRSAFESSMRYEGVSFEIIG